MNLSDTKVNDYIEFMGGEKDGLRGTVVTRGEHLVALKEDNGKVRNISLAQDHQVRTLSKGEQV